MHFLDFMRLTDTHKWLNDLVLSVTIMSGFKIVLPLLVLQIWPHKLTTLLEELGSESFGQLL